MTLMLSSRWRAWLSLSLIVAGTAIAAASLYPRLKLPGFSGNSDLVFHVAAYGALVILGGMLRCRLRWVASAVFLYSTLVEGLQNFVPGRETSLRHGRERHRCIRGLGNRGALAQSAGCDGAGRQVSMSGCQSLGSPVGLPNARL